MKSVWVAAICCSLLVPVAGFSLDVEELSTDPVIYPNSCGAIGQTPIESCKMVLASERCPNGWCDFGGGGRKKRCARWNPCTDASCKADHGPKSVCVTASGSKCDSFCMNKSDVDDANRKYPGTYKIQD